MGLLAGRQRVFADKLSQLVIRESSNMDETSNDEELSDVERIQEHFFERMAKSQDKVDKRFVNVYRVRTAHEHGKMIGREVLLDEGQPHQPKKLQLDPTESASPKLSTDGKRRPEAVIFSARGPLQDIELQDRAPGTGQEFKRRGSVDMTVDPGPGLQS